METTDIYVVITQRYIAEHTPVSSERNFGCLSYIIFALMYNVYQIVMKEWPKTLPAEKIIFERIIKDYIIHFEQRITDS